jgi:hypothetical protein
MGFIYPTNHNFVDLWQSNDALNVSKWLPCTKVGIGKITPITVHVHDKIFQDPSQNCDMIIKNNLYILQISLLNSKNH